MQAAGGDLREKFRNTGLKEMYLSLQLGVDRLPSTLKTGLMLTVADGELAAWVRDESLQQGGLGDWQYPRDCVLEFSKKLVRSNSRKKAAEPDSDEEVQSIAASARRGIQDRSMAVLPHSPFPVTEDPASLAFVLDKVSWCGGKAVLL